MNKRPIPNPHAPKGDEAKKGYGPQKTFFQTRCKFCNGAKRYSRLNRMELCPRCNGTGIEP